MTRRGFFARLGAVAVAAVVPWRARQTPLGISIRLIRQYDVRTDTMPVRYDVLYGMAILRPELAARVRA